METDDATTHPKGPGATAGGPTLHLVPGPPDSESRDDHVGADDASVVTATADLDDPAAPWSVDRVEGLLDAFFDSPWGECLPSAARLALREVLTGPDTHPFRGSTGLPFLADCLRPATREHHDALSTGELRALPVGLRQWVRFTDRLGNGVAPTATLTKLEYIDRHEPAWQEAVARLDRRRRFDQPGLVVRLRELAADVGAELPAEVPLLLDEAMELVDDLSVDRLPDEPLQLADLDPDTALRVLEIGDHCDHFFRSALHVELRTAARRLLVVVARCQPQALRRPTARSLAGGIAYAVIRGNVSRIERFDWLGTSSIANQLGISASGIPTRARALLAAADIEQPAIDEGIPARLRRPSLRLGDPNLLTAARRVDIVHHADTAIGRLVECES